MDVTVTNSGGATWLASNVAPGGVRLGAHLYDEAGQLLQFDMPTEPLVDPPREIVPRETARRRGIGRSTPDNLPGFDVLINEAVGLSTRRQQGP